MLKKSLVVFTAIFGGALFVTIAPAADIPLVVGPIKVEPATINLNHRRHPHSILVTANTADGLAVDLTAQAAYQSSAPAIVRASSLGWVEPIATGTADITITAAGQTATVKVNVQLPDAPVPYSFRHDVMPVLSKGGCNTGACHGYSLGKNGFKLSLRGADPEADFATTRRNSAGGA